MKAASEPVVKRYLSGHSEAWVKDKDAHGSNKEFSEHANQMRDVDAFRKLFAGIEAPAAEKSKEKP